MQRRALWGIFDQRHAYLHVAADRHEDHAKSLLADTTAVVTSDRWWAYTHLPLARRQLCWAHLARDFKAHAEGMAAEKEFGEHGLRVCERVFWAWEVFQHTHDRRELAATIRAAAARVQTDRAPLRRQEPALQVLPRHRAQPAQSLARALDVRPPPRRRADQQPRRTRAARRRHLPQALPRQPNQRRRTTHRAPALAHTTCRLQRRPLHAYLTDAIAAHNRGDPVPLLT